MSDRRFCGNVEVLMSYLYEEDDSVERQAFEAHLADCEACAGEVRAMRAVRGGLAAWTPPETVLDFRVVREHEKHIKKIALVTDSHLGDVAEHLTSHFVSAQIRHFPAGEVEQARQWIAGD